MESYVVTFNRIVLSMKIFHNGCIGTLRIDNIVYDNPFTLSAVEQMSVCNFLQKTLQIRINCTLFVNVWFSHSLIKICMNMEPLNQSLKT